MPGGNFFERYLLLFARWAFCPRRFIILLQAETIDNNIQPLTMCGDALFFQLGLFHRPMGDALEHFGFWPTAIKPARPKPALIGQQLRHAAFAHTARDQ